MTISYTGKSKETFAIINNQNVNVTADHDQVFDNLIPEKEELLLSTGKFKRISINDEVKNKKIKKYEEVKEDDDTNRI
jgi:hypothetical protein